MKKLNILFFIFGVTLTQCTIAQQVFAPVGAKWWYSSASQDMAPADAAYWLYESEKDTMVDGITCQKITIKYFNHLGDTLSNYPPVITYTSGDTVMYFNNYANRFTPLYFFNVSVGDTLIYYKPDNIDASNDSTFRVVVDSINFLPVNGFSLKRIYTSNIDFYEFKDYYVERFGGNIIMLPEYYTSIPERDVGPLRCYSDTDISINFTSFPCDYRGVVGLENQKATKKITVSPNPASSNLNITSQHSNIAKISFYNLYGQLQKIDLDSGFLKETQVNINDFSTGIYFLHLQLSNGESYVQKVLKK